jgi:hypothetical protein
MRQQVSSEDLNRLGLLTAVERGHRLVDLLEREIGEQPEGLLWCARTTPVLCHIARPHIDMRNSDGQRCGVPLLELPAGRRLTDGTWADPVLAHLEELAAIEAQDVGSRFDHRERRAEL